MGVIIIKDITGKIFGKLKVLRYDKNGKWICFCSCNPNKELSIDGSTLRRGFKTHCGCKRTYKRRNEIEIPIEYKNKFKVCNTCGKEKEYKDFYFQEFINEEGNKDYYFNPKCIVCDKQKAKVRQQEKKEEISIYRHQYYLDNMDEALQQVSQWRKDNWDNFREYIKEYIKTHPDKAKEYRDNHKDHDMTNNEWISCQESFDFKCAYCEKTLEEQYKQNGHQFHKEHVDNEGYNDLRNCVPACTQCNCTKHEKSIDELINKNIISEFTQDKYDKIIWWCTEKYKKFIEEKPPYRTKRSRVYNDDGTYNMQHELWTVDKKRNIIKCIAIADKKKGLSKYIEQYLDKIKNY